MKDTEIYDLQSSKEVQINFEKKTITYSKRGEIKYYESDIKILNRVLDKELKYLNNLLEDINSRIIQTELVKIKIPNGYKERVPLNEERKEKFKVRSKETQKVVDYLLKIKEVENKK
jgi:hypothetical protein|tara:strand:+ start:2222 stop:2572 length:351 start_codon:yes stop_codon:yes gene_type:complete